MLAFLGAQRKQVGKCKLKCDASADNWKMDDKIRKIDLQFVDTKKSAWSR
jgi:hypothetical protein